MFIERKLRKALKEAFLQSAKEDKFEVIKFPHGLEYEGLIYKEAVCFGPSTRRSVILFDANRDLGNMTKEEWEEFRKAHERTKADVENLFEIDDLKI